MNVVVTAHAKMHFNPRSPYGERLAVSKNERKRGGISIHAPLTGSDA